MTLRLVVGRIGLRSSRLLGEQGVDLRHDFLHVGVQRCVRVVDGNAGAQALEAFVELVSRQVQQPGLEEDVGVVGTQAVQLAPGFFRRLRLPGRQQQQPELKAGGVKLAIQGDGPAHVVDRTFEHADLRVFGSEEIVRLGMVRRDLDGAFQEADGLVGLLAIAGGDGEVQQFVGVESGGWQCHMRDRLKKWGDRGGDGSQWPRPAGAVATPRANRRFKRRAAGDRAPASSASPSFDRSGPNGELCSTDPNNSLACTA
jgi:hypothetical protein